MPRRYQMMGDVDGLEILEETDDVYRPDQSVVDGVVPAGRVSIRSLHPVVPGPLTLKTVFYDPRCSPNQRRLCFGTLLAVSALCLAILIALFVGLGKVLSEISHLEEALKHGISMKPDLRSKGDLIFVYSRLTKRERPEVTARRQQYITAIGSYLQWYERMEKDLDQYMTDCEDWEAPKDEKFCRFDWKTLLGPECTYENKFGYESGRPCILFTLRDVDNWTPILRDGSNSSLPFICKAQFQYTYSVYTNISYYPPHKGGKGGAFALNKIPTRSLRDENGNVLTDSHDHQIRDLPPLVMIQVTDPPSHRSFSLDCHIDKLSVSNLDALRGTSGVAFDFVPFYDNAPKHIVDN